MKNYVFSSLTASFFLLALTFSACQKEDQSQVTSFEGASDAAGDRAACCVADWTEANHTATTFHLATNSNGDLKLDVWNDEFTTHYRVYRSNGAPMGSVRYMVGSFANCPDQNTSQATVICNNCIETSFHVPIGNTNWVSCDERTVLIRVTGLGGGQGNSPNYQNCTTYQLSAKSPVAVAGDDQTLCGTSTFTLAAVPSIGAGTWSFVGDNAGATITDLHSATTTVTGVPEGTSVTLRWTENNRGCESSDDVVLTNEACCNLSGNAFSGVATCNGTAREAVYTFSSESGVGYYKMQGGLTAHSVGEPSVSFLEGSGTVEIKPVGNDNFIISVKGNLAECSTVSVRINWNSTNGNAEVTGGWSVSDADGVDLAPALLPLTCQ